MTGLLLLLLPPLLLPYLQSVLVPPQHFSTVAATHLIEGERLGGSPDVPAPARCAHY
jgi:hypothetical protein